MTAAVITATMAQISDVPTTIVSGTAERRLKKLYLEGPKATQNDWFLLSTYLGATDAANVLHIRATTRDSGDATVEDAVTYDYDDYRVDLTDSTTGTSFVEVVYYTE